MTRTHDSFETSLGTICELQGGAWRMRLAELPLIHGLSVLSRALADMLVERSRVQPGELTLERRLRPRENPELLSTFGVGRIRLQVGDGIAPAFVSEAAPLESQLRTILGTLQRPRYRELLFSDGKALVFELPDLGSGCRAILEHHARGPDSGRGLLRLAFERVGHRNLDLSTLPHEVVRDLERRHFLAGSTRIAHTWRDALRREAERGHRSFHERHSVHAHLFLQFEKAGLGHIERVEMHWGDAEVGTLLECETSVLDHDLKRALLALEDDGVRERLAQGQAVVIEGQELEIWMDLAQRARVLHLSLGGRRDRATVERFLHRMPSLRQLVEAKQDVSPLADVQIVLIHHITAEVLGVIAALRALGCRRITTLFVAYAGEAPGGYLGPLLDLPEEEFRAFALSQIPDASRVEGRYRLSRQYSEISGLETLDARVQHQPDFFGAMREVAQRLFFDAATRAEGEGKRLLVLEDGGYLAPVLHESLQANTTCREFCVDAANDGDRLLSDLIGERLVGSVEHTRNGHDRLLRTREESGLSFPSLSIAVSKLKRGSEAREVASSVLQALESILHACGHVLSRRHALVLGSSGAIGAWLLRFLEERAESPEQIAGIDLAVSDAKEARLARTLAELGPDRWHDTDLLLGVTGTSVLSGDDLADWLLNSERQALWVASGSTKTVEFRDFAVWLNALRNAEEPRVRERPVRVESQEILDPITGRRFGHEHVVEFLEGETVVRRRGLRFLSQLMPINFLYYGVPTEMIEQVLCSLVRAGLGLCSPHELGTELYAVDHDVDADGRPLD